MPTFFEVLLGVLTALAGALLVYWSVLIVRAALTVRSLPTARDGLEMADRQPPPASRVCVVVPAHNEAEAIGDLCASLGGAAWPDLRAVFVLDRCTDGTDEVVRGTLPGARVIALDGCPDGWAGKVHALWRGVQEPEAREADYLLFVDADTAMHPDCVRACLALLRERGLDMLSLLSTLTTERWFERLVQPVAGLELIRQYPLARANRPERPRPFANGQFILISREAYDRIGGHAAVRDKVLEDVHLARHASASGLRAGILLADGMFRCRMYTSWDEFRRGWKRIFIEAANRKPSRLVRSAARLVLLGVVLPGAAFAAAVLGFGSWWFTGGARLALAAGATGTGAVLVWLGALMFVYRAAHAPLVGVPGYPAGALLVAGILREGARDLVAGRPTVWAGRAYAVQAR